MAEVVKEVQNLEDVEDKGMFVTNTLNGRIKVYMREDNQNIGLIRIVKGNEIVKDVLVRGGVNLYDYYSEYNNDVEHCLNRGNMNAHYECGITDDVDEAVKDEYIAKELMQYIKFEMGIDFESTHTVYSDVVFNSADFVKYITMSDILKLRREQPELYHKFAEDLYKRYKIITNAENEIIDNFCIMAISLDSDINISDINFTDTDTQEWVAEAVIAVILKEYGIEGRDKFGISLSVAVPVDIVKALEVCGVINTSK